MRSYGIILVRDQRDQASPPPFIRPWQKVNSGEKNILTIEEPVEYEFRVSPRSV